MKRFPIFFAPDSDIAGAGVAIPVLPPPVAQPVTEIDFANDKVDVAKELGIDSGVRGPADIFGEDEAPAIVAERIEEGLGNRKRGADGKFLPKETKEEPAKPVVKPEVAKPAAKAATPPAKVAAAPPPKFKIGDQEKTAEEWAAYHKELSDKAAKTEKPAESAKVEEAAKTDPKPEEIEAEQKARRDAWYESALKEYLPSQEDFDKMLANGDPRAYAESFVKVEENLRKWAISTFGPHLTELNGALTPIATQQAQMAQYQAENQFLDSHPEIKSVVTADPAKLAVHRQVNEDLRQEMDYLTKFTADNPSNTVAKTRLAALNADFLGEMAKETKARYAASGVAAPTPAPAAAPTPVAKKAPPAEKPLSSDRPGTASSIKTEGNEARLARELNEHQGLA